MVVFNIIIKLSYPILSYPMQDWIEARSVYKPNNLIFQEKDKTRRRLAESQQGPRNTVLDW